MAKRQFDEKLNIFFSSLKNYKKTNARKALELYCGWLKDGRTKPAPAYLMENGKNPEAPLFGYTTAHSAVSSGKYLFDKLSKDIDPREILMYIGDWREEPELFPAEAPEPPQDVTEILGHVVHIARTLDDVSAKLDALIGKIDKLIELETQAMYHVLQPEEASA